MASKLKLKIRWIMTIPAALAGFYVAAWAGIFLFVFVENNCPAVWQDSGGCNWPWWINYLSMWPFLFLAGLFFVCGAALVAPPTSKVEAALAALSGGATLSAFLCLQFLRPPTLGVIQSFMSYLQPFGISVLGGVMAFLVVYISSHKKSENNIGL